MGSHGAVPVSAVCGGVAVAFRRVTRLGTERAACRVAFSHSEKAWRCAVGGYFSNRFPMRLKAKTVA